MESTKRTSKGHSHESDNNRQLISIAWTEDGSKIVQSWRCRKCGERWQEFIDPAQAIA